MNNKLYSYRLIYYKNGEERERVFIDTLYDNVRRVAESFPPGIHWEILPV